MTREPDIQTLRVDLDERSYDILIGNGLVESAGSRIKPLLSSPRVLTVTDENVAEHWLAPFNQSLKAEGIAHSELILPPGEQTKSFEYLQKVCEWMLETGTDRKTTLVALGGGVIGDLAGFAAAITLRGMPFVQIPTTLLSQVDSSVGGKTAIDTPQGKNLVGAFHQPQLVLADIGVLDTLSRRQFQAGYAEVVKYGLINDPAFFEWCERNGEALAAGEEDKRAYAVATSCQAKADIVAADERETAQRALLNLGHTFAHAFEIEVGFGEKLLHGEAVAIGTICAFELSHRLELCSGQDVERVRRHFQDAGLPTKLGDLRGDDWTVERLLHHMGRDKKAEAGKLTFVLTRGIGQAFVARDVDVDILRDYLGNILTA